MQDRLCKEVDTHIFLHRPALSRWRHFRNNKKPRWETPIWAATQNPIGLGLGITFDWGWTRATGGEQEEPQRAAPLNRYHCNNWDRAFVYLGSTTPNRSIDR